jgi:hypothetical protein
VPDTPTTCPDQAQTTLEQGHDDCTQEARDNTDAAHARDERVRELARFEIRKHRAIESTIRKEIRLMDSPGCAQEIEYVREDGHVKTGDGEGRKEDGHSDELAPVGQR